MSDRIPLLDCIHATNTMERGGPVEVMSPTCPFGKYSGRTLRWIRFNDYSYFRWLLENNARMGRLWSEYVELVGQSEK